MIVVLIAILIVAMRLPNKRLANKSNLFGLNAIYRVANLAIRYYPAYPLAQVLMARWIPNTLRHIYLTLYLLITEELYS